MIIFESVFIPSKEDGLGLGLLSTPVLGVGEDALVGDAGLVMDVSVKTPSSVASESSDGHPKRTLPHRLMASSARVSESETSDPSPLVVTESERA